MTQLRAPVSYYGGKQRLASQIVELLPRHTVYAEPFAGGCAVLFAKGRPTQINHDHYREAINDHDARLITLYRVLQDRPLALLRRLWATPYSEAEHQRARDLLRSWEQHDEITQAWAYYVNLQQSFSNILGAGWGRSVVGRHKAVTWRNQQSRLRQVCSRMAGISIACTDALTFIRQWDAPQTCFYCDPPYPGTNQGHYGGYTGADLQALVDLLDTIQGSFVLSNYDHPGLHIPASWERYEIQAYSSASGQGRVGADRTRAATAAELGDRQRTEVLWRVDRSSAMRRDLRAACETLYLEYHQQSLFT